MKEKFKDAPAYYSRVPHAYLTLPLVFLFTGALLIIFTSWLIARALLRPPRMTDGKAMYVLHRLSPGDLGLAFENVAFDLRDEQRGGATMLRIAGWWIPHPAARGRCVILLHGYADAKVGAIAWAPLWHQLGFNILAPDLRGHGDSGGDDVTGGFFERHDIDQVIDQLQSERPGEAQQVVLFGASYGAAVALATAELRERKGLRVCALVLDCPIADYEHTLITHASRLGAPRAVVMPLAVRLAQSMSGARFEVVRALDLAARVTCPVMLIQSSDDHFIAPSDARAIAASLSCRTIDGLDPEAQRVAWRVPSAQHLLGIAVAPEEYARRIGHFLQAALHDAAGSPVVGNPSSAWPS